MHRFHSLFKFNNSEAAPCCATRYCAHYHLLLTHLNWHTSQQAHIVHICPLLLVFTNLCILAETQLV